MDKATLKKLKNELGDESDKLRSEISQLIQKLFEQCLDEGCKAIGNDRQYNVFRKVILDLGNQAKRKSEELLEKYACLPSYEKHIDLFKFENTDKKKFNKNVATNKNDLK